MASGFSDYLENALLNNHFNAGTLTIPASIHLSLHTATVTDAGTGAEVSTTGTAYARLAVVRNTTNFPTATGTTGVISNGTLLQWAVATASWGTLTAFGIWDATTAGNLLYWGDLTATKVIDNGDRFEFPIGNLTITLA